MLPTGFTADAERLARFEREARVLAALNHPHIAAIYGFDEADGVPALVLELVEGPTLADRVATGPILVNEALALARQIADALEASHEKGIIHRDVKPTNIKITPDGVVKVLDFGLAKAFARDGSDRDLSQLPTVTGGATREGTVLGTVAYMSPEQARGKPVDKRTDIWAFGCVLYEALTARRAFAGATLSDTIAAILEREPKWDALPQMTPASVRRLLERCLEKDTRRRLRDIGDARIELDDALTLPKPDVASAAAPKHGVRWEIAAAALALLAAISLAGWWRATRPVPQSLVRLAVDLGPDAVDPASGAGAILSPDGTRLVYKGRGPRDVMQLFTRAVDQEQAVPVTGSDGVRSPFFSPDGQSVAFFAGAKLKKVSLLGGTPVDLSEAPADRGGSWGDDGYIIAALAGGPLSRVPANGGPVQVLTDLKQDATPRWPQVLPGAQAVVFTASQIVGDFSNATIEIQSLRTGQRKTLVRGGYYGRYASSGHLLYVRDETVYCSPWWRLSSVLSARFERWWRSPPGSSSFCY
jgi:serine/threonine-protein kinase